jgi:hypothetical protein
MPVIVIGVIAAAAAAASAVAKRKAADAAAKRQKQGIDKISKEVAKKGSPAWLNNIAQRADTERAKGRIANQMEIDPELGKMRQLGKEQMLNLASIDEGTKQSSQLADSLFNSTLNEDPQMAKLRESMATQAQSELDAGATLPASYQGELVRAGLNRGSQAGIAMNKNSIGGPLATVLGAAGIQLQKQRQEAAMNLANASNSLYNSRINVLSSVFPKLRDLESQRRVEAAQNFQMADQAMPEYGLTGREMVNLEQSKNDKLNNLKMGKTNIQAQQQINKGEYTGAMIGSISKGVSSIAGGAMSGGAPGGGGGPASAIGSGIGGNGMGAQQWGGSA